jgi:glycosyltransferase involved in cell wall biosynthesis
LRVLIVYPNLSFYGGAELVVVRLANYLSRKGVENTLVTLSISPEIRKELRKTKVVALSQRDAARSDNTVTPADFVKGALLLRGYVQKNRSEYDVINVHNFPAEYSLFPFGRNSVWMCNEPPIQLYLTEARFPMTLAQGAMRVVDRFVVRNSIGISCVADDFNCKRFERIYGIRPKIINYGIDYDIFSRGDGGNAAKELGLKGHFVLLQVGTMTPLKNQMASIDAVEALKDRIPNIRLVLVGLGVAGYDQVLKNHVKKMKLDKYVTFIGHRTRAEVCDLYKACDVALFPVKSQGGWLSPFEALCSGRPIIVSPLLTSSDIIRRNGLGIVTEEYAGAVMDVYKDKKKYDAMAARGRDWVQKNLTWDRFCGKMLELFRQLKE